MLTNCKQNVYNVYVIDYGREKINSYTQKI